MIIKMASSKLCEMSFISIVFIVCLNIASSVVASNGEATIIGSSMYRYRYKPNEMVHYPARNKRTARNTQRDHVRYTRYAQGHPLATGNPSNPNSHRAVENSKFIPVVPSSCKNTYSFCTTSENYPSTYVNDILEKKSRWVNIIDEIDKESIGNRFGEDVEENEPICLSEECIIYPKLALNKDNDWFFIVNNDKFKQGVRVELCLNEGNQCNFTEGFPVRAVCRQKYIYRTMVALDYYGVEQKDKFKMPSCCSCSLVSGSVASASTRQSRQSPKSEIGVEKCQKFVQN